MKIHWRISNHFSTFISFNFLSDIDECENSNSCINGKCKNIQGSFKCLCPKGFARINTTSCWKDDKIDGSRRYLIYILLSKYTNDKAFVVCNFCILCERGIWNKKFANLFFLKYFLHSLSLFWQSYHCMIWWTQLPVDLHC